MKLFGALLGAILALASNSYAKVCVIPVSDTKIWVNGREFTPPAKYPNVTYSSLIYDADGKTLGAVRIDVKEGKIDLSSISISSTDAKGLQKRQGLPVLKGNLALDNAAYSSKFLGSQFCSKE